MDEGLIVHFEDYEGIRKLVRLGLAEAQTRHHVVGEASNLLGALSMLEMIGRGELTANTILLDGNLSNIGAKGHDARIIRQRIWDLGLPVRVIGNSSYTMDELEVHVDCDIPKSEMTIERLVEVIDGLDEPETMLRETA